jgi:hypothetical protein
MRENRLFMAFAVIVGINILPEMLKTLCSTAI